MCKKLATCHKENLTSKPCIQELYDAYGAPVEVLYEDGLEMARIGLRAAMLSSKESIRTTKQLVSKSLHCMALTLFDHILAC